MLPPILLSLLLVLLAQPAWADVCLEWAAKAERLFDIPSPLLQAIVLTESGDNPFALNIDGRSYFPLSRTEAAALLAEHRAVDRADIGCAQISMRYHADFFAGSTAGPFDPQGNLVYAAWLLSDNKRRYGSWAMAVARYHSTTPERQVEYVCRVMDQLARLSGRSGDCRRHLR